VYGKPRVNGTQGPRLAGPETTDTCVAAANRSNADADTFDDVRDRSLAKPDDEQADRDDDGVREACEGEAHPSVSCG
jgi:hypothetical protein